MSEYYCTCDRGDDFSNRVAVIPNSVGDDICINCGGIVPPEGFSEYELPINADMLRYEKHDYGDEVDLTTPTTEGYAKKAWKYYMDFREEEALHYINKALDLNDEHANNWDIKAIILEGMKRYAESEECYNRSLELSPDNLVYDNKARMLYDWAVHLRDESKKLPNGLNMLNDAYDKVIKAMNALPGENSEEDLDKYLKLRDSINFYIDNERKYHGNLKALKKYDKKELFTITGMHFYKNDVTLTSGMPLKLVKEPDNEFDNDAIAVYAEDEKIGYVANNEYTKFERTSSASELQDKLEKVAQASYLFYLDRFPYIQFHIGRIIK